MLYKIPLFPNIEKPRRLCAKANLSDLLNITARALLSLFSPDSLLFPSRFCPDSLWISILLAVWGDDTLIIVFVGVLPLAPGGTARGQRRDLKERI
ncbi:MAG: hypothetical protein JSW53_05435 [Candidatus Bathyarchaeota archaeon]|nr:MAG: hypothetical protein JSW53_05435 [Candidatus Bathyarchaeota archaeon]